jgi:hypothetical protein
MPSRVQRAADYLPERAYQERVKSALDRLYGEVVVQWRPFLGEGRGMYAPVVDVAVGPFANVGTYINEYAELLDRTRGLVEALIHKHNENMDGLEPPGDFEVIKNSNENSRCLLCIEIEESGSRKHCLGNLVNASALGRIGILVARNQKVMEVFKRQRAYLSFLAQVKKNSFKTENALVLTEEQFNECVAAEP